jgi:prepilin signal peptidase PulO-like enzyme (type II secretory pathway)
MTYILIFLIGTAVGSFLNVVICRLETGEDLIKKRSHCVECGRVLRWYDLVPVISFFVLRGRCRDCGKKISWQYPVVEIATGVLFVLMTVNLFPELVEGSKAVLDYSRQGGFRSNNIISLFSLLYVACSLIVIFVYDLRHYIIPDKVLFPAIGVAFVYRFSEVFFNPTQPPLNLRGGEIPPLNLRGGEGELLFNALTNFGPYLFAALAAAGFFLFLVLVTRGRGMGIGDIKLAILMGLVLGWPQILLALFLAFFSGAAIGLALIAAGEKTMKSQVPFGPFLIAGTFIALFWGQQILDWWPGLMR